MFFFIVSRGTMKVFLDVSDSRHRRKSSRRDALVERSPRPDVKIDCLCENSFCAV